MFYDEIGRIPKDEKELWEILREQFWIVREVLRELPIQEKEHLIRPQELKMPEAGAAYVSYRGDKETDARDDVLERGSQLLACIHQAMDEKKISPKFIQQW
jgi:hypothetical protein